MAWHRMWTPRDRTLDGSVSSSLLVRRSPSCGATLVDLCAQLPDEPLRDVRFVPPGAECVAPLAIAELSQQIAHPRHVFARDAIAHEFVVPAVVREVDVAIVHAEDIRLAL